jgi:hypothetical protein
VFCPEIEGPKPVDGFGAQVESSEPGSPQTH